MSERFVAMSRAARSLVAWVALASLPACGDDVRGDADAGAATQDAAASAADAAPPPDHLLADGAAMAESDDGRVECTFYVDIIDIEPDGDGGWSGTGAGEVFRRSFDPEGNPLFEFQALMGGPVSLTAGDGGAVVARLAGDQPGDAMPFWLELEELEGERTDAAHHAGDWTCAPILPGDPTTEDLEIDAPGTWTIAPPP